LHRTGRPGFLEPAMTAGNPPGVDGRRGNPAQRVALWIDDRLGASRFARSALDKIFPDHWSFMVGEIALYCFVILVLTGSYLTFFFRPSENRVTYTGSYKALQGLQM